jgi:hypothetical protein
MPKKIYYTDLKGVRSDVTVDVNGVGLASNENIEYPRRLLVLLPQTPDPIADVLAGAWLREVGFLQVLV